MPTFEPKAFGGGGGNVVTAIKTIIDMMRGKKAFDPYEATAAALEIAQSIISVFTPKNITVQSNGVFPEDETLRNQMIIANLANYLPPEERASLGLEENFTVKFMFPTDMVVNAVLLWVLGQILEYGGQKLKEYLQKRREQKEKEIQEELSLNATSQKGD